MSRHTSNLMENPKNFKSFFLLEYFLSYYHFINPTKHGSKYSISVMDAKLFGIDYFSLEEILK